MRTERHYRSGFTVVELLIVIVVIAVLAAIVIIGYNGVQNSANDTAVQTDLHNVGESLTIFYQTNGYYPTLTSDLTSIKLKAAKNSYSTTTYGTAGDADNFLYCYGPTAAPTQAALISISKSGKVFQYIDGAVSAYPGTIGTIVSSTICSTAGVPIGGSTGARIFFYQSGGWSTAMGG